MDNPHRPEFQKIVAVVATGIILFTSFYIANIISGGASFSPQSAAVVTSQLSPALGKKSDQLTARKLYGIVSFLNNQIKKSVSAPAGENFVPTATPAKSAAVAASVTQSQPEKIVPVNVELVSPVQTPNQTPTQVTSKPTLDQLISQRKYFMTQLAKVDTRLFSLSVLPPEVKNKIPSSLISEIENDVSINGELEVVHVDDFSHEDNDHYEYSIITPNGRLALYLNQDLPMTSMTKIRVQGVRIGDIMVAQTNNVSEIAPPPKKTSVAENRSQTAQVISSLSTQTIDEQTDSVGRQRTLVLLLNFQDAGPAAITPSQLANHIFNGEFERYYEEQSFGKVQFTGDVMGWYTLPRNFNGVCPAQPQGHNETATIIFANHIDLRNYDRLVLVSSASGCGYGTVGKTTINTDQGTYPLSVAWLIISNSAPVVMNYGNNELLGFDTILAHEIGHNLGLLHANGWDCGAQIYTGNCQHVEYGNPFDVMGQTGLYGSHFNAAYKDQLGWVSPANSITINHSGQYTINPLESLYSGSNQADNLKRFAKIQIINSSHFPYYLELRKGIGFDSLLNNADLSSNQLGLSVNRLIQIQRFTRLLDMRPTSADWLDDSLASTLNIGNGQFTDPATGVTIGPVTNVTPTAVTFNVGIAAPVCEHRNPLIQVFPLDPVVAGNRPDFYINFGNADSISCPPSAFRIETNLSSDWQPTISPSQDVTIQPDDSQSTYTQFGQVFFTVPPNTPIGTYPIQVRVINENTGYVSTQNEDIVVTNPPTLNHVSPTSGQVGTRIVLTGSYLSHTPQVTIFNSHGFQQFNLESDGNSVALNIPSTLYGSDCGGGCMVQTPPGTYQISVFNGAGFSNTVDFTVIPQPVNTIPLP